MSRLGIRGTAWIALTLLTWAGDASAQPTFPAPDRFAPTEAQRGEIQAKTARLAEAIQALPPGLPRDLVDDVAVYLKAAQWVDRLGEYFDARDVATTLAVIDRGTARAGHLAAGGPVPWASTRGAVIRAYTSKVDGSVQPYAVIVPEGLEFGPENRARLDVILHGRNQTLSEVRFIATHDGKPAPPSAAGKITLHVFGRTNNAYRWAGEADVFEAIEAVKSDYPIDDRRVVLRGFSMGGAGAWHLGLHHPSLWSSVEAGAGFTETKNYAKLKDVPEYQLKTLRIYDAEDYALNAFNVPIVGYGGEDDPQLQASTNVVEALKRLGFTLSTEGLLTRAEEFDFLRVVGANMGHKVDPASAKIMDAFHDERASPNGPRRPRRSRFVTYTLKYGKAAWFSIEAMTRHYDRAEVDAEIQDSRVIVHKAENVDVLAVDRHAGRTLTIGGTEFPLELAAEGLLPNVYFRRVEEAQGSWRPLDHDESRAFEENAERGKRRGLQGPIDDAFTGPFLCVRGTGKPRFAAVARWSDDRLARFQDEWPRFLRGDLRVKKDVEVNQEDIENYHLILFGDPDSNWLIGRVNKDLPLDWGREWLNLGGESYAAAEHAPVLIAPNPLNPRRYVVINSGHTFGAREFRGTNALLHPRLGDWAVFHTGGASGSLRASGFFDEGWSRRPSEARQSEER
ncbi:MAG: alpha/beta hydrolase-fold protein [Isosphaeraceae bacterium]